MQLLDVTLAFALTLAALATVVTIIMETVLRALRTRKKNLVELMKLLNQKMAEDELLGLSEAERWTFLKGVIRNPAGAVAEAALDGESLEGAFKKLGWRQLGRGVYDRVSLEHVLRRLAELPAVQEKSRQARDKANVALNRLALKFEELSSAISADFKRRAQLWSIVFGVAFAVSANVEGVRIFDAYLADEKLTQTIIAKQSDFEKAFEESQQRTAELDQRVRAADDALTALNEADGGDDAAQRQALDEALAALAEKTSPEAIEQSAQRAQAQLADLQSLGIPIGWGFYPACPYGSADEKTWRDGGRQCSLVLERHQTCVDSGGGDKCDNGYFNPDSAPSLLGRIWRTVRVDMFGFLKWLLIAVGTGLLIGLGAPFWFDVAKRLAQVRRIFSGTASSETRMSGKDADGNATTRTEIVERVVRDAAAAASSATPPAGPTTPKPEA